MNRLDYHAWRSTRDVNLRIFSQKVCPQLSLTSEMARREFLIAPVLTDVLHDTQAILNVEYPRIFRESTCPNQPVRCYEQAIVGASLR